MNKFEKCELFIALKTKNPFSDSCVVVKGDFYHIWLLRNLHINLVVSLCIDWKIVMKIEKSFAVTLFTIKKK